jgi:hypothetical protein
MFKDRSKKARLLESIKVLSNYMMFHLVERPYMLPGSVRQPLPTSSQRSLRNDAESKGSRRICSAREAG